jgi:adenylate cyclase
MRRVQVSLNISILTVFLALLFTLAGLLTWFNYTRNSETALLMAEQILTEVNGKVLREMRLNYAPYRMLAESIPRLPDLPRKPKGLAHPLTSTLLDTLANTPHLYSLYMGYADGDFYQAIAIPDVESARASLGAPAGARFALRHITGQGPERVESWGFLDAGRNTMTVRTIPAPAYDPRVRTWYRQAIKTDRVIKTNIYVYASLGAPGTTLARRFGGREPGGVFGVDVTLDSVSAFLREQQVGTHGQVIVFAADGQVTGHPDPKRVTRTVLDRDGKPHVLPAKVGDLGDPVLDALYARYTAGEDLGQRMLTLDVEGKTYLAMLSSIPTWVSSREYVAVIAPESDFTGPVAAVRTKSLIFSLVLLLAAIPLVAYAARHIVRPLSQISAVSRSIRDLDLDAPFAVSSRISEVSALAEDMQAMKTALQTFGRYVPRDLVRRLMLSGNGAEPGGQRRELTLLFTDVEDFTRITEPMTPEEVMHLMSSYFQEAGGVIGNHGGTIDKFIGDAVMAFWNAPERAADHTIRACAATLRCAAAVGRQEFCRQDGSCQALRTRFGLHRGEVVVGNVGSSDRINYTALGAAVNMASRVEGLNKYFGTTILATETVHDNSRESFLFRSSGRVVPKGATTPLAVYELLGALPGTGMDDIVAPAETVGMVRDWEAAFALYHSRDWTGAAAGFAALAAARPGDRLAAIYRQRAESHAAADPGEAWTGVEEFHTK